MFRRSGIAILLLVVATASTAASAAPPSTSIGRQPYVPPPGAWLEGADASGPSDVWAVGGFRTSSSFDEQSYVIRWDGSTWASVSPPDVGRLTDVTVVSSTDVWAMGSNALLHWDGSSWTTYHGPGASDGSYSGISAAGPDDVWVVGLRPGRMLGPHYQAWAPLTGHWDGTRWTRVPNITPRRRNYFLGGVVADRTNNVWAAGYVDRGHDRDRTFVLRWDGSSWSHVPSPSPRTLNVVWGVGTDGGRGAWALGHVMVHRHLRALFIRCRMPRCRLAQPTNDARWTPTAADALSTDAVWAVGSEPTSDIAAAHWNGDRWRLSIEPHVSYDRSLLDVVAAAKGDVWAVGWRWKSGGGQRPLVERWDGAGWVQVDVPKTTWST